MFTTNTEFLKAEMADVLRLFGDVPDVAHTFVYAENNFMNAVIDEDRLENKKPMKQSRYRKIDGVITLLMTIGLLYKYER